MLHVLSLSLMPTHVISDLGLETELPIACDTGNKCRSLCLCVGELQTLQMLDVVDVSANV